MVITQDEATARDTELWHKIANICNTKNFSSHDIQEISIKLAEGQYFYTEVKKEGCLLYDAKTSSFAEKRELTPAEDQRIAQYYFDHWYGVSRGSYRLYQQAIDIDEFKEAAFNLHQATVKKLQNHSSRIHSIQCSRTLTGLSATYVHEIRAITRRYIPNRN